jgi:hypothetical protein
MRTYELPKQDVVAFYIDGQIVKIPVKELNAVHVNLVAQGGYLYFVFLDPDSKRVSTVRGGRCDAEPEILWSNDHLTHDAFAIIE